MLNEQNVDRNSILAKFDDAKRSLAKLLARENISVQVMAGQPTASFDVVGRVLTLPDWPSLTVDQLDTQIGHEVGHALFTNTSYLKELEENKKLKKHPGFFTYINVVEDARIERKMREAYPGMLRTFYEGRRAFAEKGPVFQVADRQNVLVDGVKTEIKSMSLIDRLNAFHKIGAFVDVPFKPEERKWIQEIAKAWSTERAVEIARELHELAKDEIEQQQKEQKAQQGKFGQASAGQPGEGVSNDDGEEQDGGDQQTSGKSGGKKSDKQSTGKSGNSQSGDGTSNGTDPTDKSDEDSSADKSGDSQNGKPDTSKDDKPIDRDDLDPESKTDKAMSSALAKMAAEDESPLQQIRHVLLKPLDSATVADRTISNDKWVTGALLAVEAATTGFAPDFDGTLLKLQANWNALYLSTAENMASEFLRKKTAKNLQHARLGKTGRLDMSKLSKFKFAEDLFKRTMVVPNGQSHGIVMLIDGSSSMINVFAAVLDQVLLFAHFAFKCNIPFECFMFTSCNDVSVCIKSMGLQTITLPKSGTVVQLIDTNTNRGSFRKQVQAVLLFRNHFRSDVYCGTYQLPYVSLGNTPLYSGMMIVERHIERMKRTLKLDKMMSVVISDGQDNAHLMFETQQVSAGGVKTDFESLYRYPLVVRDTVTKKNHVLVQASAPDSVNGRVTYSQPHNAILTMLFDVFKDRHDCRNIYLYLTTGREHKQRYGKPVRESDSFHATRYLVRAGVVSTATFDNVVKSVDETGQFIMASSEGVADCAMVLKPSSLTLSENEFAAWKPEKASQKKVQTQFIKAMTKAKTNRIFVNAIMPFIA